MCASLQTCVQTFGSGSTDRSLSVPSLRRPRPLREPREIGLLRRAEKLGGACDGAFQPARAKVILPPFHERGLEFDRENFLHDRNVLVNQLLLKVDRVRGDDRFRLLLDREKRRRDKISERLANPGTGFDDEMPLLLEAARDRRSHRLLLRTIFEVPRLREESVFRENRPHSLDKIALQRIFQSNHAALE